MRTRRFPGAGLETQLIADARIEFKSGNRGWKKCGGKKGDDTPVTDGPRIPISTLPRGFARRPPPRSVIPQLRHLYLFARVPLGGGRARHVAPTRFFFAPRTLGGPGFADAPLRPRTDGWVTCLVLAWERGVSQIKAVGCASSYNFGFGSGWLPTVSSLPDYGPCVRCAGSREEKGSGILPISFFP